MPYILDSTVASQSRLRRAQSVSCKPSLTVNLDHQATSLDAIDGLPQKPLPFLRAKSDGVATTGASKGGKSLEDMLSGLCLRRRDDSRRGSKSSLHPLMNSVTADDTAFGPPPEQENEMCVDVVLPSPVLAPKAVHSQWTMIVQEQPRTQTMKSIRAKNMSVSLSRRPSIELGPSCGAYPLCRPTSPHLRHTPSFKFSSPARPRTPLSSTYRPGSSSDTDSDDDMDVTPLAPPAVHRVAKRSRSDYFEDEDEVLESPRMVKRHCRWPMPAGIGAGLQASILS